MFLCLGSLELFFQEGEKKRLRNHFGFLWSLSASWRQCGCPCAGIQVMYGCCRSQFHVLPDKPRFGFSRGAGMSSESLHELQGCETGTYLSNLADNICLLRLIVSLLEFLLPPAMFPASRRCFVSLWVPSSEALPDSLEYANSSLSGMVHSKDLTCAPVPALLISKYMDWRICIPI